MKRYCQTLELVNDPKLIEKYCEIHAHVWPEVVAGQREVGILDMQLYRYDTHVFMICDTVDDFASLLVSLPALPRWLLISALGFSPTSLISRLVTG